MKNRWVTPLLLLLLVVTAATSVKSLYGQGQVKGPQAPPANRPPVFQDDDDFRAQFPEVDYEPREPGEAKASAERVKRNSRYDKRAFVISNPARRFTSVARLDEGYHVPAIPAERSSLIIVGEVLSAQAHLSNDKLGVYSEFAVRVGEVLKTGGPAAVAKGDEVTVEREGGTVRYPNGYKRRYELWGQGMPRVGRSYALFLSAVEGRTYDLLTGYELRAEGVAPIDYSKHFAAYEGHDPAAFLEVVRAAISQTR